MKGFAVVMALLGVLVPVFSVQASEPASHDVALPTTAGETLVIEWTGTALPGVSGVGTTGGIVDPAAAIPCLPLGVDDAHTINLTVPEGAYEDINVVADFVVEWDEGTEIPGVGTDPDLVLTLALGATTLAYSDGGTPTESVGLTNPEAGAYQAIVCPYLASAPTPYRGKLTLTAIGPSECVAEPSKTLAHSTAASQIGGVKDQELPGLANFDRHAVETLGQFSPLPLNLQGRRAASLFDRALGKTSFLWARNDAPVAAVGALNNRELLVERARAHLRSEAKQLGLSAAMINDAVAFDAQYNGEGPAVVRFRQRFNGHDVFQRSLNVLLDRANQPVAVSGYFATGYNAQQAAASAFAFTPEQAIAQAWRALGGVLDATALTRTLVKGDYELFAVSELGGSHVFEREPRLRRVYYPRAAGLEPAYEIELFARARISGQLVAYTLVVSALDASILQRKNLKSEAAYSYRTFADSAAPYTPHDSPFGNDLTPFPGATPEDPVDRSGDPAQLVTLEHAGIGTGDPWLADDATTTVGNHAEACIDVFDTPVSGLISNPLNTCDPLLGDIEPPLTGQAAFDYPVEPGEDPSHANAQAAAAVSLFYMVNWMHDVWYNHGFDEVSGNAQTSNYGRGGVEGDPLIAQGQDASGRGNANMSTPSDGSSPTMQQYLFDGPSIGETRVTAPTDSGPLRWAGAQFGPDDYDLTGDVAMADELGGDIATDGCGIAVPALPLPLVALPSVPAPPQTSLAGKIALIDRGGCNFTAKAQFAVLSGAAAVIVVNNTDGAPFGMSNGDLPISGLPVPVSPTDILYRIPALMIRKADGEAIKAALATGETVTMRLQREPSIDIDATFDNQIVAHEYFHYVHHRLTDSSNQQSGAMSEGWGDIGAFMLSVREDDIQIPGNDRYQGAYGLAGFAVDNFFAGIRRAPYSTDFNKNAFTFRHIADGEPTPDGGAGAGNSGVHNAGEIWANAMFECYVGILNQPRHSFVDAQSRMRDYIIGGFKMTPANATYTEARDAVLSVVLASDFEDYRACSAGFAKRGMGRDAVAPSRSSTDLVGVVEDYSEFVCKTSGSGDGNGGGGDTPRDQGRFGASAFGLPTLLSLLGFGLLGMARRWSSVRR
ncbi:MAG: M36 family metallopeptidase [Pseudomonadota bacterium]|nr:M36 family metallopeptidase [Pseudomonadota bacterium]